MHSYSCGSQWSSPGGRTCTSRGRSGGIFTVRSMFQLYFASCGEIASIRGKQKGRVCRVWRYEKWCVKVAPRFVQFHMFCVQKGVKPRCVKFIAFKPSGKVDPANVRPIFSEPLGRDFQPPECAFRDEGCIPNFRLVPSLSPCYGDNRGRTTVATRMATI